MDGIFNRAWRGRPLALDFACGTGRVVEFLAGRFPMVVGVDISESMLAEAAARRRGALLVRGDVTVGDFISSRDIQVMTSMRFFLNAQEELRRSVLAWMREHLSEDGILVCNFHLNPWSLHGLYYRAEAALAGRPGPRVMSLRRARRLLEQSGFEVVSVHRYGLMPYRRSGLIGRPAFWMGLERLARHIPGLRALSRNFVLVARKGGGA